MPALRKQHLVGDMNKIVRRHTNRIEHKPQPWKVMKVEHSTRLKGKNLGEHENSPEPP